MAKKQHNSSIFSLILFTLILGAATLVASSTPVSAESAPLSDSELGSISQNCGTIKQSLTQLQRADSRTRVLLGAAYESVASRFIIPLNLRLVRNNLSRPTLSGIQSDFTYEQGEFRSAYTRYMREMDALLAIDCRAHPAEFHTQLTKVRTERSTLEQSTARLSSLISDQLQAVRELQASLKGSGNV